MTPLLSPLSPAKMRQRRTPVTFANRHGMKLFGVLHEPDASRSELGPAHRRHGRHRHGHRLGEHEPLSQSASYQLSGRAVGFERKQVALALKAAGVSRQLAVAAHDAVAGNDDRQRVASIRGRRRRKRERRSQRGGYYFDQISAASCLFNTWLTGKLSPDLSPSYIRGYTAHQPIRRHP